jgi:CRISPR-associated exonuclease Cas4
MRGTGPSERLPQVPLSALEHYAYCPRQAGLILLEEGFADDASTVRGTLLHRRVHEPDDEVRPGLRTLRALPVWHDRLGLTGVCDVVELHADGDVVPVEHKSGSYVAGGPADVQVAAQALCLEERFRTDVPVGMVYSAADRRRHPVPIDEDLRTRVRDIADAVRQVMRQTALPRAVADGRCRRCSMNTDCMPKVLAGRKKYERLVAALFVPGPDGQWDD